MSAGADLPIFRSAVNNTMQRLVFVQKHRTPITAPAVNGWIRSRPVTLMPITAGAVIGISISGMCTFYLLRNAMQMRDSSGITMILRGPE
jgi:hypothetical protein